MRRILAISGIAVTLTAAGLGLIGQACSGADSWPPGFYWRCSRCINHRLALGRFIKKNWPCKRVWLLVCGWGWAFY
jgi:hypothetical protein